MRWLHLCVLFPGRNETKNVSQDGSHPRRPTLKPGFEYARRKRRKIEKYNRYIQFLLDPTKPSERVFPF